MQQNQRHKQQQKEASNVETTVSVADDTHSLMYNQDYEYELSVIADMEKRENERKRQEECEILNIQEKQRQRIETRDFHIKQILRKLKLGSSTNTEDRCYILLLESWMESAESDWKTEYADSLYSFLEKGLRLNPETKEYMRRHIHK